MHSINSHLLTLLMTLGTALLLMSCSQSQSDLDKIELKTLAGKPVKMTNLKGQIVFINFWATWCRPCIKEMPTIAKAKETLKDEKVIFLFPSNESVDLITDFKARSNFDFDFVQAQNLEALNIQALPTTMIFNAKGERIFSEAGFRDWSTPENLALITEAPQP